MAYKIGNTVVIDDNAALGSVSGNSLNLANNSNISGGGSASLYTSSTPGATSGIGSGTTVAFLVGGGGAGALQGPNTTRANHTRRQSSGGSGGATAINAFDSSNLSSVDITIGAKGTTSANTTGNGGGATLMSGPNIAPFGAVGGNGSSLTPNAIPNAGQAYSISAVTDYSYDNTPAARTFRGASPVPSGPNFNPSWNNQDGLVTSLNVALAGSPSGRGQFRPNSGNSRANTRVFGGSSVMSAHNNSTGSPTYDPGNNFGYGQGGMSFDSTSLYYNTPGTFSGTDFPENAQATSGCVLLIGF